MAIGAAEAAFPFAPATPRADSAVRAWIWCLAALVVAMVAVGGATRLTGSGLSITEWRPVTGAIPPLSEGAWLAEFERYRAIPQYELVNKGMSLAEFKVIYAWEWGHRQLGRLIGLVFAGPLAWFWWRGRITGRLALAMLAIGALGGLQGAVGWIMVRSGLQPGMTAVAPVKLMLHLTLASAILASLVWVATGLKDAPRAPDRGARSLVGPRLLLALVLVQIALGALVAGSRAGLTYNTWPLMDGELVPSLRALFVVSPWIENFVDNVTLVQFNHRLVAYLLVAAALVHAIAMRGTPAAARAGALALVVLAQAGLGIVTLLLAVPLWAGLAHQLLAMAALGLAAAHARLMRA
ncbi:MAG TPA: COX15/CtaA family protein [Microvirga sp.]|jgi:cytochrome c oxidase assembly protein subunit 15|nr:COX15/CtaA family protein [Microvirga sp.]